MSNIDALNAEIDKVKAEINEVQEEIRSAREEGEKAYLRSLRNDLVELRRKENIFHERLSAFLGIKKFLFSL